MKKVTAKMLDHLDDEAILEYINSLEDSIEESTDTERKLDTILENILQKFDDFKDFRYLRASNIAAINELLKTKKSMRDDIIANKKAILDIVMKKRASDAKNKTMLKVGGQDDDVPRMDFKTLLIHLDKLNIQPEVDQKALEAASSMIDTQGETLAITAGGNTEDGVE